jgi:hypothetical protein
MINDYQDELTYTVGPPATSKQTIVGVAGTAIVGGKVKDGGAAGDWGAGSIMKALLRVVTAVVGATGGIQFDLVGADNALLTTNPVVLATKTIPTATLILNYVAKLFEVPAGTRKRYLGIKITPLTTNSTAGEVIVSLVPGEDAAPQDRVNSL